MARIVVSTSDEGQPERLARSTASARRSGEAVPPDRSSTAGSTRRPAAGERDREPAISPCGARLVGARFAAITEAEAVHRIVDAASAGLGHWTITANLDHLRRYREEPVAKRLIDEADLVVADGMPLIWASRIAGVRLPERVAGSNMIWSISELACERGQSVFLLGGSPGVADRAALTLLARYDGLEIVGTVCPPLGYEQDPEELGRIERRIAETRPQIVFVGLGFPKQDLLIRHLRNVAPQASFIGVGISLSYVTGEVSRAPRWSHRLGLEWVFRLLREPRRLFRRYLLEGVPFALWLLTSATRHRMRSGSDQADWGWDADR